MNLIRLLNTAVLVRVVVFGAATLPTLFTPAWAQNKNNKNAAVKREQHDVQEARDKVNAAKREADAAKQAARAADGVYDKAVKHVADVRRTIEQMHDSEPALQEARRKQQAIHDEFEALKKPILEKLAQSATYQAAIQAREAVRQKLANLPVGAAATERETLGSEHQVAQTAVRQMEDAAINGDSKAKAARVELSSAEAKVRAQVEKRNAAVDRDPRLAEAKKELDKSKDKLAQAKQKLATELKQLADAEKKLNHEEAQKRQAEQAAKKNNNNNKKKK